MPRQRQKTPAEKAAANYIANENCYQHFQISLLRVLLSCPLCLAAVGSNWQELAALGAIRLAALALFVVLLFFGPFAFRIKMPYQKTICALHAPSFAPGRHVPDMTVYGRMRHIARPAFPLAMRGSMPRPQHAAQAWRLQAQTQTQGKRCGLTTATHVCSRLTVAPLHDLDGKHMLRRVLLQPVRWCRLEWAGPVPFACRHLSLAVCFGR